MFTGDGGVRLRSLRIGGYGSTCDNRDIHGRVFDHFNGFIVRQVHEAHPVHLRSTE